jgi:hypothetical protein
LHQYLLLAPAVLASLVILADQLLQCHLSLPLDLVVQLLQYSLELLLLLDDTIYMLLF